MHAILLAASENPAMRSVCRRQIRLRRRCVGVGMHNAVSPTGSYKKFSSNKQYEKTNHHLNLSAHHRRLPPLPHLRSRREHGCRKYILCSNNGKQLELRNSIFTIPDHSKMRQYCICWRYLPYSCGNIPRNHNTGKLRNCIGTHHICAIQWRIGNS